MLLLFGTLIGGLLGYGLHKLFKSPTGESPLANPWVSSFFGAFLGLLVVSSTAVGGPNSAKEENSKDVKVFTTTNWDKDVLKSDKPVLVDFWAPWCGPCRMEGPLVEQVGQEVGATAVVGKLNIDENPEIASRYHIDSIPDLIVFKKGQVQQEFVGLTPPTPLKTALMSGGK